MENTIESGDLTIADMKRIFGLEARPIDTAEKRLAQWSESAGSNMLRLEGGLYSWDTRPRQQKNGALVGRVHVQPHGQMTHDAGGYKIEPDGTVSHVPAALRGVLPGTEAATASDDQPEAA